MVCIFFVIEYININILVKNCIVCLLFWKGCDFICNDDVLFFDMLCKGIF